MATPQKLNPQARERRIAVRAGLFVTLGLALAAIVVFLLGKERQMFQKEITYVGAFENVDGLQLDAPVRLGGLQAGKVSGISFAPDLGDKRIMVTMEISQRFHERVRRDSVARITGRGVLGDKALDISLGSPETDEIRPGGEIATGSSGDISSLLKSGGEIVDNAVAISRDLRVAVSAYTNPELAKDVSGMVKSARNLLGEVETGKGAIHSVIYDKQTADELHQLLANAAGAATKLDQAIGRAENILQEVQTGKGSAHALIYEKVLAKAIGDVGSAAEQVATLVGDAKKQPNGAINQLVYGDSRGMMSDLAQAANDLKVVTTKVRQGRRYPRRGDQRPVGVRRFERDSGQREAQPGAARAGALLDLEQRESRRRRQAQRPAEEEVAKMRETRAGEAVSMAVSQAFTRSPSTLFAVLVTTFEALSGLLLTMSLWSMLAGGDKVVPVAFAAAIVCLVCSRLLLAIVHGGAIRQSVAWLEGRPVGTALEQMWLAAPRSLSWFSLVLPLDLLATVWKWVGIAATTVAYLRAFGTGHAGGAASLALAMFIVTSIPLALAWGVIKRASLVSAVRDELPSTAAFGRAAITLITRPLGFTGLLIGGAVVAGVAHGALAVAASLFAPRAQALQFAIEPRLINHLVVALLGACLVAVVELVVLYGFAALAPLRDRPVVAATT